MCLCTVTCSCWVAKMVLSRYDLRTTYIWEHVPTQRPSCGAPLGAHGKWAALSSAHSRPRCINEPSRPVPKAAGRSKLLLEGRSGGQWSTLGVRKPPGECCEGNKRNALETATWRVGARKRRRLWHSRQTLVKGTKTQPATLALLTASRRSAKPEPCGEAGMGYRCIVCRGRGMVFQILPIQTKQLVTCGQAAGSVPTAARSLSNTGNAVQSKAKRPPVRQQRASITRRPQWKHC